jgi:hypothetical protein
VISSQGESLNTTRCGGPAINPSASNRANAGAFRASTYGAKSGLAALVCEPADQGAERFPRDTTALVGWRQGDAQLGMGRVKIRADSAVTHEGAAMLDGKLRPLPRRVRLGVSQHVQKRSTVCETERRPALVASHVRVSPHRDKPAQDQAAGVDGGEGHRGIYHL